MATLYIHGFASSGESSTATRLREILGPDETVLAPTLSHSPAADFAKLADIVRSEPVTTVVGSSLGGLYAIALAQKFDVALVVINPALRPYDTLAGHMGTVAVYDSDRTFPWTQREIDELREIAATVDAALDPERSSVTWRRALVLLGAKDEVVDAQATAARFPAKCVIMDPDAGHRFGDISLYADRIRAVAASAPDSGEDNAVWGDE